MRSFIAVPVSMSAEQQLADISQRLKLQLDKQLSADCRLHWVVPKNYHLTLAFLGEIKERDRERLEPVIAHVAAKYEPSLLQFTVLEWFPSPLKPRLIIAVPEPSETLIALQRSLVQQLRREGFQLEKRAFRPHLSLARVRSVGLPVELPDLGLSLTTELDEIVLYKSELSVQGPRYTPLFVESIGATL